MPVLRHCIVEIDDFSLKIKATGALSLSANGPDGGLLESTTMIHEIAVRLLSSGVGVRAGDDPATCVNRRRVCWVRSPGTARAPQWSSVAIVWSTVLAL